MQFNSVNLSYVTFIRCGATVNVVVLSMGPVLRTAWCVPAQLGRTLAKETLVDHCCSRCVVTTMTRWATVILIAALKLCVPRIGILLVISQRIISENTNGYWSFIFIWLLFIIWVSGNPTLLFVLTLVLHLVRKQKCLLLPKTSQSISKNSMQKFKEQFLSHL